MRSIYYVRFLNSPAPLLQATRCLLRLSFVFDTPTRKRVGFLLPSLVPLIEDLLGLHKRLDSRSARPRGIWRETKEG